MHIGAHDQYFEESKPVLRFEEWVIYLAQLGAASGIADDDV